MNEPTGLSRPNWPAVVKLNGVDELIYLTDTVQWRLECSSLGNTTGDILIDTDGNCFDIHHCELCTSDDSITLAEFDGLVRAHLVAMQQCCVYKLELKDFTEGMRLVRDTEESR